MKLKFVTLLSLMTVFGFQQVSAQTLPTIDLPQITTPSNRVYMSPSGNDANSGQSPSSPVQTFDKALSLLPFGSNGNAIHSEIYLLAGNYNLTDSWKQSCSNLFSNSTGGYRFVSLAGEGRDLVTINATANINNGFGMIQLRGNGIYIRNLTLNGNRFFGTGIDINRVDFSGCIDREDIEVSNVKIINTNGHALFLSKVNRVLADRVILHDNCLANFMNPPDQNWASALKTRDARNVTITNCEIFNNWGEGIGSTISDNVLIENNTVYDNFSLGIYPDGTNNCIVRKNLVYSGTDPSDSIYWFQGSWSGDGIGVNNEYYSYDVPGRDTVRNVFIYSNVILNCARALQFGTEARPANTGRTTYFENIWYANNTAIGMSAKTNAQVRFITVGGSSAPRNGHELNGIHYINNIASADTPFDGWEIATCLCPTFYQSTCGGAQIEDYVGDIQGNLWSAYVTDTYCIEGENLQENIPVSQVRPQMITSVSPGNIQQELTPTSSNFLLLQNPLPSFVTEDFYGNTPDANGYSGAISPSNVPPTGNCNVISNGDFRNGGEDWDLWLDNAAGTNATLNVNNNQAEVAIVSGGTAPVNIRFRQFGLELRNGATYKLSFKARAASPRSIQVKPRRNVAPYTDYHTETINLTTAMAVYSFQFTMNDADDLDARLSFYLGGNNASVYLDDITLVETGCSNCNVISNGGFRNGGDDWNLWLDNAAGANATLNVNNEAEVAIGAGGIAPVNIRFRQFGLELRNGATYKLSFRARATSPRSIQVKPRQNVSPYTDYHTETINLTAAMAVYSFQFTMNNADDLDARLSFFLGGDNASVYLDDITLAEVGCDSGSSTKLELKGLSFDLYPNPANESIHLDYKMSENKQAQIDIYDAFGKLLKRQTNVELVAGAPTEVEVSQLLAGVYFCRVQSGESHTVKKFVIAR